MNRRMMLAGLGAGAMATPMPAFAGSLRKAEPTPFDVEVFLHGLRTSLDAISARVATVFRDDGEAPGRKRALYDRTTRALFAYGVVTRLPLKIQTHPGVQDALHDATDELSGSLREMRDLVGAWTPEEVAAVDGVRQDPELIDQYFGWLRSESERFGVGDGNSERLGKVMERVGFRLKRQRSRVLVDELVDQVDRIEKHGVVAPPSVQLSPADREEVEASVAHWDRHGLARRARATGTTDPAKVVFGVLFILVGGVLLLLGIVATVGCFCLGIPLALLGLGLLIAGIFLISKAKAPSPAP